MGFDIFFLHSINKYKVVTCMNDMARFYLALTIFMSLMASSMGNNGPKWLLIFFFYIVYIFLTT